MKQATLITIIITVLLCMLTACDGLFSGKTTDTDSISEPVDSTLIPNEITVKGVAVDGSRRNIYVTAGSDTLSFELSPDIDFSWEIGDSIIVKYYHTDYGDSVTYISTQMQ